MGQFITVDSDRLVNTDTITAIVINGAVVTFFTSDGNGQSATFPDNATAADFYSGIITLLSPDSPAGPPTITQAWPTAQGIAGGFPTVIIGTNFKVGADIQINGVSQASITFLDSRTYAFITQPIGGGTYAVDYIGPDAQTASLPNAISFT